jgi:hypothetical protein
MIQVGGGHELRLTHCASPRTDEMGTRHVAFLQHDQRGDKLVEKQVPSMLPERQRRKRT